MKPPVLFAYVLIGLGAFYYGSSRKDEEISVKNERINFLDDQIAAYKDRLQGATPDEAAKEIAALREGLAAANKQLDTVFPSTVRTLDDKTKNVLTAKKDELAKFGQPIVVIAWTIGDSLAYANDFTTFFNSIKVATLGPLPTGSCNAKEKGVIVGLSHPDNPSAQALQFTQILKDAGLNPTHTKWFVQMGKLDFDLFICPE